MLRTDTEEEMNLALANLIATTNNDGLTIDHIGPIIKMPIIDGDGIEITPGSTDSRWHSNIRVVFELSEEQIAVLPIVNPPPTIPYRVFC